MKSVALDMRRREACRRLGTREARNDADILSRALLTAAELCQRSMAILRFQFASESKPDQAGHTSWNQLMMKADALSVRKDVIRGGAAGNAPCEGLATDETCSSACDSVLGDDGGC
jgi:hypothetical protein